MYFDGWVRGYKVQIRDWIDGKNFYLNMQEFAPGSSIERKPDRELSVLVSKKDEHLLQNYLDSIVHHFMEVKCA